MTTIRYFAFGTMMTGNSIYTAEAVAKGCWHDVGVYVSLIGSFLVGMATFRCIDALMRAKVPHCCIGPATVLAPLVLVCFTLADLTYYLGDSISRDNFFQCGKTGLTNICSCGSQSWHLGILSSNMSLSPKPEVLCPSPSLSKRKSRHHPYCERDTASYYNPACKDNPNPTPNSFLKSRINPNPDNIPTPDPNPNTYSYPYP